MFVCRVGGVFLPVSDRNQHRRATIRRSWSWSQVVHAHRRWSLRKHDVRLPLRGLSQMIPAARSKRSETDEKGDRSEPLVPGQMGANEKARRDNKQRSSRSRHGATVLHARRPPPHVRMSRVLSIPEARIKSTNPFVLERYSNVVPDACRSFYTTLPRSSYPSESGTPTSTPVVNVCPGTRCSTTTAHRASFVVIRTLTLLKLSSISNSRTIVTLIVARARVCVCVRACVCVSIFTVCMWNKRDVCVFEMHFNFRILHTNACTNKSFIAVSLVKLHTIFRISTPLLRYRR